MKNKIVPFPESFECPDSLRPHMESIFQGEYDLAGVKLPESCTILDIGACVGAFTLYAKALYPDATIYGYEINHSNRMVYGRNTGIMPCMGVTEYGGPTFCHEGKNNIGECSRHESQTTSDLYRKCDTVSANQLPPAQYLKIDTEGDEVEILTNYQHLKCVNGVGIEWHSHEDRETLTKYLEKAGFQVRATPVWKDGSRGIINAVRPEYAVNSEPQPTKTDGKQKTMSVEIGIPVHYAPTARFVTSLENLRQKHPQLGSRWNIGDSHVDRSRFKTVQGFMSGKSDWLLFLDADLCFEPEAVERILQAASDTGAKVVCGFYAAKSQDKTRWIGNVLKPHEEHPEKYVWMREAGTGALLIHRDVFEQMKSAWPERFYLEDGSLEQKYAYFASGVRFDPYTKRRRWMSEDWWFSHDCREMDFRILGVTDAIFLHEGPALFPIQSKVEEANETDKRNGN